MTLEMFKCLIFVQGLTALDDSEIRLRLLTKLEQDQKIILQNLADERQRIWGQTRWKLRNETFLIFTQSGISQKVEKKETSFKINPWFGCGELYLFKNCPFKNKQYKNCGNQVRKFSHGRKSSKVKRKIKF